MDGIIKQLIELERKLHNPSPYRDMVTIQEDFRAEFLKLSQEEDFLNADFAEYCLNIAGTLDYVLKGKSNEIPKRQIEVLQVSFFDLFKQYKFLEKKIGNYKDFFEEYKNHETIRNVLLQLLK